MDMPADIKAVMDAVDRKIAAGASVHLMNLGRVIDTLQGLDRDKAIRMDFSYSGPGFLDSYRGYYSHLAFMGLQENRTVGGVLDDAMAADGETFEGWKGGSYTMSRETPMWWATEPRDCHDTGIVRISDEGYCVVIHTAFVEL